MSSNANRSAVVYIERGHLQSAESGARPGEERRASKNGVSLTQYLADQVGVSADTRRWASRKVNATRCRRCKRRVTTRANWMNAGYLVSQERMYADGALNLCHLGWYD